MALSENKLGGPFWGCPYNQCAAILGSVLGSQIFGNSQIHQAKCLESYLGCASNDAKHTMIFEPDTAIATLSELCVELTAGHKCAEREEGFP